LTFCAFGYPEQDLNLQTGEATDWNARNNNFNLTSFKLRGGYMGKNGHKKI
jgi:hypothetical protein